MKFNGNAQPLVQRAAAVLSVPPPETHGDFQAFIAAVISKSKLDLGKRAEGEVHFTSTRGERVGLRLAEEGRPTVWRNGMEHDWRRHWNLWSGDAAAPIKLGWKQGALRVQAGDREFAGTLKEGRYSFENR